MGRPIDEVIKRIGNGLCPYFTIHLDTLDDTKAYYGCGKIGKWLYDEACSKEDWKHCPLIHPWGDNPVQVD